jgi:hypothetical protein
VPAITQPIPIAVRTLTLADWPWSIFTWEKMKPEIVGLGASLGVDFAATWSSHESGQRHCGRCGTCVQRQEAFERAGVPGPTVYEAGSTCAAIEG